MLVDFIVRKLQSINETKVGAASAGDMVTTRGFLHVRFTTRALLNFDDFLALDKSDLSRDLLKSFFNICMCLSYELFSLKSFGLVRSNRLSLALLKSFSFRTKARFQRLRFGPTLYTDEILDVWQARICARAFHRPFSETTGDTPSIVPCSVIDRVGKITN
jgi:hypothetical protein